MFIYQMEKFLSFSICCAVFEKIMSNSNNKKSVENISIKYVEQTKVQG